MTCTADLSSSTPVYVRAPTFVFERPLAGASRSEALRLRIAAAREAHALR
ncbi:MAG: hypothetical protein PGN23_09690 [Sphingomonas adhaesiva]